MRKILHIMTALVGSLQCFGFIVSRKPSFLRSARRFNHCSNVDMAGWTIQRAQDAAIKKLTDANVIEPEFSVPHLLAAALNLDWESGYRQVSQPSQQLLELTKSQAIEFDMLLNRRLKHEPIQYILGQWDFLDYTIKIRPPLLCPRPETEELVTIIVEEQRPRKDESLRILDIGSGTGVIGVSLADKLPNSQVQAIDIEPIAVETSIENAQQILAAESSRYQAILSPVMEFDLSDTDRPFDLVVSNPPYIPTSDYEILSPDVKDYESEDALHAGVDGLTVVHDILQGLSRWCRSGAVCWMEVDPTHPELLKSFLSSAEGRKTGVTFLSTHNDMFGKTRFVKLQYQEASKVGDEQ